MKKREYSKDPFNLAPLWDAMLDVYLEFAAVCKKHNLRHYVVYGTLLGAVRHKGFIPWDDDFDVAMPRQDYEKLKTWLSTELPFHLKFVDHHNTSQFPLLFGKIQDTRKDLIMNIEEKIGKRLSNGIFIDIFPIDGYPQSFLLRRVYMITENLHHIVRYYREYDRKSLRWNCRRFLGYVVGWLLSCFVPCSSNVEQLFKWNEKHIKRLPFEDSSVSGMSAYILDRFHAVFPPNLWGESVELDFCGICVPGPMNYHAFLERVYGNYMELPPEEKRYPNHSYAYRCPWWLGPTQSECD